MEGLLFSSDVEVGAFQRSKHPIQTIVPPAFFRRVLDVTPLAYLDEEETKPVFINRDDVLWFEDGALFEVAYQPASTPDALYNQVQKSIIMLNDWLEQYKYEVLFEPVGAFELKRYAEMEDIYQASIAGCNPDKNALIRDYTPKIISLEDWNYRGMGGHVHMSVPVEKWGNALHMYQRDILRLMVVFAGNASVYLSTNPKAEEIRLEYFGHPGSYRTPLYPGGVPGFEYRAPSSTWLKTPEGVELMFKAVDTALTLQLENAEGAMEIISVFVSDSARNVLIHNKVEAEKILNIFKLI